MQHLMFDIAIKAELVKETIIQEKKKNKNTERGEVSRKEKIKVKE